MPPFDSKPRAASPSTLLVSMPWTTVTQPSLGLGILRAVLDTNGIPCRVLHLNLFLLEHLKATSYQTLANVYALNDFLFSATLDPAVTNMQQRLLRQKTRELMSNGLIDSRRFGGSEGVVKMLLHLRNVVLPAWLETCADEIASHEASLVGFTCMFDQTIASLALARLVKERAPKKMLVLGGYAVHSPTAQMLLRSSPWISAICDGEGEVTVVELALAAAGKMPLNEVRGIVFRSESGAIVATQPAPPVDLDLNPTPNFDDFFTDVRRLSEEHMVDVSLLELPIENSRGCWWGSKSHCVFCGIRDEDLAYRLRSAEKTLECMAKLHKRYGVKEFRFADYILPNQYFNTLLPELARLNHPYWLGAEVKANLTEERFKLLAQAGFREVQPGIESFSSDTLRKMHKGVSAMQNVYTLLLGSRFNISIYYNLLYGFPDDDEAEYDRMAMLLPRLFHLASPVTCLPVQITRYAPLQRRPEAFGIARARADECYELVFSKTYVERCGFDFEDYCYNFERTFENSVQLQRTYDKIDDSVNIWRSLQASKQTWLYQDHATDAGCLTVRDKRGLDEMVHYLDEPIAEVLLACAQPVSLDSLRNGCLRLVGPEKIEKAIDELDALGLVFREERRVVSLVLSKSPSESMYA